MEAVERLERAKKALPPKQLLERQELAKKKKDAQLRLLERELNAELGKEKQVRARDVPITTYVMVAPSSSCATQGGGDPASKPTAFVTPEEQEALRKERIRQRSRQLLESAELPPRMALALGATVASGTSVQPGPLFTTTAAASATGTGAPDRHGVMSVKMKKQLAAQAEEDARKLRLKPKPVPNFDHLHTQWEQRTKTRKASAMSSLHETQQREFFMTRAATLAELKAKKQARREKQLQNEERERQAQRDAQVRLLEKTKASSLKKAGGGGGNTVREPKPTKADELRVKKVLATMVQQQKQQEQVALDAELRQQKMKRAAKRVAAQVKASEKVRLEGKSDYVSIHEIDQVAKQRALEFKRSLKESIQHNKQRILGAVARKPSLMERYATDLKREEHKKNALEAVVKNVFQKNLSAMKGILTDEEHDLARDIIAADSDDEEAERGAGKGARVNDDEADEYSDAS